MNSLIDTWLARPSVPLAELDRHKVTFKASQLCGGTRAGRNGNWIVAAFVDPPSIDNMVDDVALDDFVVFHPDRPDRFRAVYGSGVAMLGESHFDRARLQPLANVNHGQHLPVFRTPLTWLQQAGAGVVPLDLPAFGRSVIGTGIKLVAEDLQHGEQLDRAIRAAVDFAYPTIQVAA